MRTLTLGVLIVSGGTLAALPFRRYQAIPDSSSTPVHATGPTDSALKMGAINPISGPAFTPPQMADAMIPGSILATHSDAAVEDPDLNSLDRIANLSKTGRSPDAPLTYEDLVLPIEMPDIVQQRFNATAAVKSIQMEKERLADTPTPRMEPMTAASSQAPFSAGPSQLALQSRNDAATGERSIMQPGTIDQRQMQTNATGQPRAENRVDKGMKTLPTLAESRSESTEMAAGTLASTATTSRPTEESATPAMLPAPVGKNQLPKFGTPSRPRHWIRQPD